MWSGIAMVTLAAASWGTWSVFLRPTHLPSTVTSPIIFLVMGLVALPLALRRSGDAKWDRATLGLLVLNAVFDATNVLTFFGAMSVTTVSIAVLTHYLAPIFVALAAPSIDKSAEGRTRSGAEGGAEVDDKTPSPGARPAAAIALVGLAIVLEPWHTAAEGAWLGALLGVASAVCYAGNVFTVRRLAARIGAPRAMAYHSLLAAVAMAPLAVGQLTTVTTYDIGLLAVGAATIGAASGIVFAIGLLRIGSARAAVLTFAEPLVAVAVGALVWDEPLHPLAAVGGALVLGAGIQVARNAR